LSVFSLETLIIEHTAFALPFCIRVTDYKVFVFRVFLFNLPYTAALLFGDAFVHTVFHNITEPFAKSRYIVRYRVIIVESSYLLIELGYNILRFAVHHITACLWLPILLAIGLYNPHGFVVNQLVLDHLSRE